MLIYKKHTNYYVNLNKTNCLKRKKHKSGDLLKLYKYKYSKFNRKLVCFYKNYNFYNNLQSILCKFIIIKNFYKYLNSKNKKMFLEDFIQGKNIFNLILNFTYNNFFYFIINYYSLIIEDDLFLTKMFFSFNLFFFKTDIINNNNIFYFKF